MICWCLFIISVISISRLVRLFTIILYLLKPVGITHYLEHVYDNCWLFCYFPCLTYIQMHIFHVNSLFWIFLHMFVLPDVASSGIAAVGLLPIIFSILDVPCWFTATLHIILSYKFYFVFSSDIKCISIACMNISIYMLVWENYIFIDIFDISVNNLHISWWIFSHKCIVYKVFQ